MTFEEIVRMSQPTLKMALTSELQPMGYQTVTKHGFTYGAGSLPVLLVAHLDTVHREPVKTVCYSHDGKILMSPQGIGGDDRAGVYMILQIIKRHHCHVLFCEDEEFGGIGATKFVQSGIMPKVNYIVELDRHGSNDAVFYDCDNPDFIDFVCEFGFQEAFGSFSDVCIVAPQLGIAAVNISAGYYHEHALHEYVDMDVVAKNIRRVGKMVSTPSGKFEYMETAWFSRGPFGMFQNDIFDLDAHIQRPLPLMPLPEAACIKLPDGEFMESDMQYFMDESGMVYKYLFDLDAATELKGYTAITVNGLPVKFDWNASIYMDVVPAQYVYALEEEYGERIFYG